MNKPIFFDCSCRCTFLCAQTYHLIYSNKSRPRKWNIQGKVKVITVDNEANMDVAVKWLGGCKNGLFCTYTQFGFQQNIAGERARKAARDDPKHYLILPQERLHVIGPTSHWSDSPSFSTCLFFLSSMWIHATFLFVCLSNFKSICTQSILGK